MSIENHMSNVREALYADINKNRDVIFNGLVENAPISSLPESVFVNYFLPCFIGQQTNPNWVMEWISIAGTPMAEVNVIKDGTQEILFRVPGILSTNTLFNRNKVGISDVFSRYDQLSANMPSQGLNFLMSALGNMNKDLLDQYNLDNVKRDWLSILQRYNLVQINTPVNNNQNDVNLSDYFEL